MNAYKFIQSVSLCSRTSPFQCGQFLRFFFCSDFLKQSKGVALARSCLYWLVKLLLLLGAVAEAKLKLATPSCAGIIPFRFVVDCYFNPKLPVSQPRFSALLSSS